MLNNNVKILNKTLSSALVTKNKSNVGKYIFNKGLYYYFNTVVANSYPLELYLNLIDELVRYDMVFIKDSTNENWIGVYINSINKSITIPEDLFKLHLNRYKNLLSKVCIINIQPEDKFYEDLKEMDDVEFEIITKEPKLVYPEEKLKRIIKTGFLFSIMTVVYISISFYNKTLQDKNSLKSTEQTQIMNQEIEIIKELKTGAQKDLAGEDILDKEIKTINNPDNQHKNLVIQAGRIKWL